MEKVAKRGRLQQALSTHIIFTMDAQALAPMNRIMIW